MAACACIPDYSETETGGGKLEPGSPKPVWTTKQDPVSKNKSKKKK
jgi:hypothetical protein